MKDETQIIKAMLAKYRREQTDMVLSPHNVVAHPDNRGGESIQPRRLQEITAVLALDGVDVVEASGNAVVVELPPDEAARKAVLDAGGIPDCQANFGKTKICKEAMSVGEMKASDASMSHTVEPDHAPAPATAPAPAPTPAQSSSSSSSSSPPSPRTQAFREGWRMMWG